MNLPINQDYLQNFTSLPPRKTNHSTTFLNGSKAKILKRKKSRMLKSKNNFRDQKKSKFLSTKDKLTERCIRPKRYLSHYFLSNSFLQPENRSFDPKMCAKVTKAKMSSWGD